MDIDWLEWARDAVLSNGVRVFAVVILYANIYADIGSETIWKRVYD
jgi:hypothetical protein